MIVYQIRIDKQSDDVTMCISVYYVYSLGVHGGWIWIIKLAANHWHIPRWNANTENTTFIIYLFYTL